MLASYLLSLREGLEAALIIGIVLGALTRMKRTELNAQVWKGVGAGGVMSLAAAIALNLLGMEFEGRGEQIFEGAALLLAAGVLTWMIFWMREHGKLLKGEIERRTSLASLGKGGALFALAFLAVFREGIELALYLLAARLASSPLQMLAGALMGLASAAALGWGLFSSTRRLNLGKFFSATNILLVIFAAGMVGLGVRELNEAGIIPAMVEHVWNLNPILSDQSEAGMVLKALVGYNSSPSLSGVIAYLGYLAGIITYLWARRQGSVPLKAQEVE